MSTDGSDARDQPHPESGFPPPPPLPQSPPAGYAVPEAPYAPGQPPQYPVAPQPPAKKGLGTGAIVGIIVGAVVVLIAIVALILAVVRPGGAPAAGGAGPETVTPGSVVQGYLEALAASDAETALSYIDDAPTDSPFLTDEALAASNALAPITDIEVTEPTDATMSVRVVATYSIGDVPVTAEYSVHEYAAEGVWQMTAVTAELDFAGRFEGLDMTLNGIPLEESPAVVFPGTYEVATTTPNFVVTGEPLVTVREPFDFPSMSELNASLSEEGVLIFRQAVKDAVAVCLASKNFVAGCGLDLPETLDDGTRLIDGTLTRSLAAEAQATLENLQPQESYSDPLVVSGDFIGGVRVTADVEKDGQSGNGEVLFAPSLGAPVVDFTSGTPVVRWD